MAADKIQMIPVLELIRLEEHEPFGTFGVLKINKQVFCVTLEPPDRLNEQGRSSIPAQQYTCRRYFSPKYPNTFEITGVPGRTAVLFHPGNTVEHTAGCVILAQHFGKLGESRAVLNSGQTFNSFMELMAGVTEISLTIREVY